MWFKRKESAFRRTGRDPTTLTLRELIATQPRHVRGSLAPGERFPTGMRPGRRRAQGMDLDSIGPYVPGDDIRWMDWRATARTGRAQMKRFIAESHLARMLIVDLRRHLFFGTETRPMAKSAALLAAHMAWEAFTLQEPVGLIVVPDMEIIRPRRARGHVLQLLEHIEACYAKARDSDEPPEAYSLAAAVDAASSLLRHGDEICLFSDFGIDEAELSDLARGLSGIRHLRAIVIEDPIFSSTVPAGRYPLQTIHHPERQVANVTAKAADRHRDTVTSLRQTKRRQLIQDGWRLTEAISGGFLAAGGGSR